MESMTSRPGAAIDASGGEAEEPAAESTLVPARFCSGMLELQNDSF
jgi:hypothetical protein